MSIKTSAFGAWPQEPSSIVPQKVYCVVLCIHPEFHAIPGTTTGSSTQRQVVKQHTRAAKLKFAAQQQVIYIKWFDLPRHEIGDKASHDGIRSHVSHGTRV